jgi:hypothetical protein
MDRKQELEQQLWELVYELLPEEEAEALRHRITSEPDVARAYAEVKLQSELIAQALRHEAEQIKFAPPAADSGASAVEPLAGAARSLSATRSRVARVVHGVLSLAAVALLCVVGYSYLGPRSPFHRGTVAASREALNQQLVYTTLFGPERLPPRLPGHLAIHTWTATGAPRPVEVAYRVYDRDARLLVSDRAPTDAAGWLQIRTPPVAEGSELRLEVEPQAGLPAPLHTVLAADREKLALHLAMDQTRYRPGDTVRYRSLALAPCARQPVREVAVEFKIQNADGAPLPGSRHEAVSDQGVAAGEFSLPPEIAAGRYLLAARSPRGEYAPTQRPFSIQPRPPPAVRRQVEFARDRYAPGDEVVAHLTLRGADGKPAARAPLRLYAEVNGQVPLNLYTATDDAGTYQLKFTLPKTAAVRGAKLAVTVGDPPREHVTESIPVGSDEPLARELNGSGRDANRPAAGEPSRFALETKSPVVAPNQPVTLDVRASQTNGPLAIVASADDVTLGQALVPRESFQARGQGGGVSHVAVPVVDEAQGLLRLTAYDLNVQPPRPVAERFVLRQARQKLQIQRADPGRPVAPGNEVQLELAVRDEADRPRAAALGVKIVRVSDAAEGLGPLETQLALQSGVPAVVQPLAELARLGDASAWYAAPLGAVSRDHRELREPVALAEEAEQRGAAETAESLRARPAVTATPAARTPALTALVDNTNAMRAALDREVAAVRAAREVDFRRIGQILIAGAIALLLGLGLAGLARLGTRGRVWVPVLVTAAASLLIGVLWLGARVDERGEVAWLSPREAKTPRAVVGQSEAAGETAATAPAAPAAREAASDLDADRTRTLIASQSKADAYRDELRRATSGDLAQAEQPVREALGAPRPTFGAAGAAAPPPAAPAEPAPAAVPHPAPPAAAPPPPSPAVELSPVPVAAGAPVAEGRLEKGLKALGKEQATAPRDRAVAEKKELAGKMAPAKPTSGGGLGGAYPSEPKAEQPAQLAESQPSLPASTEVGGGTAQRKRASDAFAYRTDAPARLKGAARAGGVVHPKDSGALAASEKKRGGAAEQEAGVWLNRYGGKAHEEPRTIYWQPLLRTDPDGHATVRFTLPDQPGTYRVEIVGHADGRRGFAASALTAK